MILKAIFVFIAQMLLIWVYTLKIRKISSGETKLAMLYGMGIDIFFLVKVYLGIMSINEIFNGNLEYLPVIFAFIGGGVTGTYLAMRK